jgi:hypothetical protein
LWILALILGLLITIFPFECYFPFEPLHRLYCLNVVL